MKNLNSIIQAVLTILNIKALPEWIGSKDFKISKEMYSQFYFKYWFARINGEDEKSSEEWENYFLVNSRTIEMLLNDFYEMKTAFLLACLGCKIEISYKGFFRGHFDPSDYHRHIYSIKLTKNRRQCSFDFGTALNNDENNPPSCYDVITCLQKYDVGSFDDFCSEFGYNNDSIKDKKRYKAVCREYENMSNLFSDYELGLLSEIQ